MDSQFRCGKCSKPISSKFEKCPGCGSLGPHIFTGSPESAIEGGMPIEHKHGRRDYPAELVDRPSPHPVHPAESYEAPAPMDIADEAPRPHPHPPHEAGDDSRFPAGMKSRSPILNYVEDIDDSSDEREERKRRRKERDDEDEDEERYKPYDEDEAEDEDEDDDERQGKGAPEKSGNTAAWIIGIILVLVLIIVAIYVINNYEELTKWLASPTVPNVFKPSE